MHLHFNEVPLSSVRLSTTEESGEVATAYGLASSICRHRLSASHFPMASFYAPRRASNQAKPPTHHQLPVRPSPPQAA